MPGEEQPPQQQAGQQQGGVQWNQLLFRFMIMYFGYNFLFGKRQPVTNSNGQVLPPHTNLFTQSERMDLFVYFSESEEFNDFENKSALVWKEKDLYYDWSDSNTREHFLSFPTPQLLQNNGTLYAHVYICKSGVSHIPTDSNYERTSVIYRHHSLNKYLPIKPKEARKNLISGEPEIYGEVPQSQLPEKTEIVSHWKPNLTLHLVDDFTVYPRGGIPIQVLDHLSIDESGGYFPVLFFDEFWLFREHLIPLNETVTSLNITLSYSPISLMKWQMMLQMEQSFSMQRAMGTAVEDEADEFKRMLVETNAYLLGLTMVVTILHTIFDFLAFKNDISFWKNKKSVEGISVRTMFVNFVCQIIIFLYLLDNDTSWVILISAGIGLAIEAWKIQKAVIIKVDWNRWPYISMTDRESYSSKTKTFDEQAMRYLSYVAYPLVVGYSIYSLVYQTHRSWYSWILSSLTGTVYTFGFIMMCPQLFINYKLKSVAHLPWRTFMYKALNTFIDDLFAFIIKMPTLHRLSCFRDDIIFLIYLYQRWIYPTDYKRVNEFGQGGEDEPSTISNPSDSTTTTTETKKDL